MSRNSTIGDKMASKLRTMTVFSLALALALLAAGCNSFTAFNQGVAGTDQATLISRGNIAVDEGRFADALELFERAAEKGNANSEIWRGKASSRAGLSGFNMFKTLQVMQNGVIPGDSPATVFLAAACISDKDMIKEAIEDLWQVSAPTPQDRLLRGLLIAIYQAKILVNKYDTNLNGKLDKNDQIDFDTRDDKTELWSAIYNSAAANSGYYSLELAFADLCQALEGRGDNWVLISPIQGQRYEGNYTAANRSTILALANFADQLEVAQVYFDNSESLFKQTLTNLDGSE